MVGPFCVVPNSNQPAIFVPADSIDLKMYGQTQMLKVSC